MHCQENLKILLVEDDEGHAELVKLNLERSGLSHQIMHFTSGKKILDFLKMEGAGAHENKYLIILDINMPGLDGRQVLARLKDDPSTRSIPVIMLTTAEDEREIDRCYALGCNLYISKPIDYREFFESIYQFGVFIQKAKLPSVSRAIA